MKRGKFNPSSTARQYAIRPTFYQQGHRRAAFSVGETNKEAVGLTESQSKPTIEVVKYASLQLIRHSAYFTRYYFVDYPISAPTIGRESANTAVFGSRATLAVSGRAIAAGAAAIVG